MIVHSLYIFLIVDLLYLFFPLTVNFLVAQGTHQFITASDDGFTLVKYVIIIKIITIIIISILKHLGCIKSSP